MKKRIERALAGRQGNPTGANQHSLGNPQKIAEFQPKGESRDIAAKAVDMNRETYRPDPRDGIISREIKGPGY